jgi:hypothetical protein
MKRSRILSYGLKTLFLLVAVAGLFLALVVVPRLREARAIRTIEELGHHSSGCPIWFVTYSSPDAIDRLLELEGRVELLWLKGPVGKNVQLLPGQASSLKRLRNLEYLHFEALAVDELLGQRVVFADGLMNITLRSLKGERSAAGVVLALSKQTTLKDIEVISCESIDDRFLEVIAKSRELTDVLIIDAGITGTGFAHFEGHPDLDLHIEDCPLSNEGLDALSSLSFIRSLTIHVPSASREALWRLTALPKSCGLFLVTEGFSIPALLNERLSKRLAWFDYIPQEQRFSAGERSQERVGTGNQSEGENEEVEDGENAD